MWWSGFVNLSRRGVGSGFLAERLLSAHVSPILQLQTDPKKRDILENRSPISLYLTDS